MIHTCHAIGCLVPVRPQMLMCLKHWRMVPKGIQREVWRFYRKGQCDDKTPSKDWLSAASRARDFVRSAEEVCKP